MEKNKKKSGWFWGFLIIVGALIITLMFIVPEVANQNFEAGYNYGWNDSFNYSFNQGINWTIGWTHKNCVNYICDLNNTNCENSLVKQSTELQCYDIIGRKQ